MSKSIFVTTGLVSKYVNPQNITSMEVISVDGNWKLHVKYIGGTEDFIDMQSEVQGHSWMRKLGNDPPKMYYY